MCVYRFRERAMSSTLQQWPLHLGLFSLFFFINHKLKALFKFTTSLKRLRLRFSLFMLTGKAL